MNLRFYIICVAVLIFLGVSPAVGIPFLVDGNVTATVHGTAYAWDTFEPLNNTVVEINSNPPQSKLAKNGTYSFELAPGTYTISAKYYQNNSLIYSKETTLEIESEGTYVLDLLLFPVSENTTKESVAKTVNVNSGDSDNGKIKNEFSYTNYLPVFLALLLLAGGSYKLLKKNQNLKNREFQEKKAEISGIMANPVGNSINSGANLAFEEPGKWSPSKNSITETAMDIENESPVLNPAPKKLPLSKELSETLDIIRGHKGKITQKDLRSKLDYSEVKISLLLSELEKRGLIKKLKNGRENILILVDKET